MSRSSMGGPALFAVLVVSILAMAACGRDSTPRTTPMRCDVILRHHNAAGGDFDDYGNAMTVDAQGRILVAGNSQKESSVSSMVIWRLYPDGQLDSSFGGQGWVTYDPPIIVGGGSIADGRGIAVDGADRVVVVGSVRDQATFYDMAAWRYLPDGSPDPSFGTSGFLTHDPVTGFSECHGEDVVLDPFGRIVIAGRRGRIVVWRLLDDGALDPTFDRGGYSYPGNLLAGSTAIALDGAGRILLTGWSQPTVPAPYDMFLARLSDDGTPDPLFGGDGFVVSGIPGNDYGFDIVADPLGRIIVAGEKSTVGVAGTEGVVWRFDDLGNLDSSFGQGGTVVLTAPSTSGRAEGVALDSSGRIVLVGNWSDWFAVWRLQDDGSHDPSFGQGGAFTAGPPNTVAEPGKGLDAAIGPSDGIYAVGVFDGAVTHKDMVVWTCP